MISIPVKPNGKLYKTIMSGIRERVKASAEQHSTRATAWRKMEELFVGYLPEKEDDALRRVAREGGTPEYTTIQVPYSYAVATAAHSYWCNVFLSRVPVYQFAGMTDEGENGVLAVEALMHYQLYKARQLANLYIWLQDAAKYGEAWLSPYWREDKARVATIVEVEDTDELGLSTGQMKKVRQIQEVVSYQGNALHNLHPSRVFTDPRFPRNRFQDGEFVAIKTTLSLGDLLEGRETSQYINVELVERQTATNEVNWDEMKENSSSEHLEEVDTNSFGTSKDKNAQDVFDVYEVTINLIPSRWGLGKSNLPEKWVFTVTTDYKHIFEARPLGNIHNKFPLVNIEIDPEGYYHFSRSLMEIFGPVQNTLDWLVNSHLFNVRQALNNQFVFDPSRVYERDLERREPGKAIRLKPAAYGTDVRTALQQIPVQDMTASHLNDMQMMYDLGERLGVNDPVMGVTDPSSRRSATEIRGNQTFSVSRLRTISEYFSCTGWDDLASMQLSNSQQFYTVEKKLRLVGSAAEFADQKFFNVTPDSIAGEYMYEPVDGTLPVDRYAQANLWRELIGQMYQVPQVVQQYDLGKIFGYVAQLAGIKNINRFKVQVVPDQAILNAAQAGNVVPASGPSNDLEPGQIPGVGPTA